MKNKLVVEKKVESIDGAVEKSLLEKLYFIESSSSAIATVDLNGMIDYVNPAFLSLWGFNNSNEVLGEFFSKFWMGEYRFKEIMSTLQEQEHWSDEVKTIKKDGTTFDVLVSVTLLRDHKGDLVNLMSISKDLTERKYFETQVLQSQKMEALGALAGGIVHDFNNLLTGIISNATATMEYLGPSHPHYVHLVEIEKYVNSAISLTKQLLGFARSGKHEVIPTNINEIIKSHNCMFGRTRKEVVIRGQYEEMLWTAAVDANQIHQVLMNIYVNAWQAMPHGGDLYVQTENIHLDRNSAERLGIAKRKYILISVNDTGIGMDEDTQQKVFDPFFTTKEKDIGTGLGLSSAYGIIKNHNGHIIVNSEPGKGTTFKIYLPASQKKVKKEKVSKEVLKNVDGTILVIDDEEVILDSVDLALKKVGYNIITAKGGKTGIKKYKDNQDKIDMIILDMIMPDISGSQTYDKLKEINPGVKVLISSGFNLDSEAKKMLEKGCKGFMEKPFNKKQLSNKINEILKIK